MPVSKKRKKDGKPVHRSQPAGPQPGEEGHTPEGHASPIPQQQQRMGKPTNPFVAQQGRRASQRGR